MFQKKRFCTCFCTCFYIHFCSVLHTVTVLHTVAFYNLLCILEPSARCGTCHLWWNVATIASASCFSITVYRYHFIHFPLWSLYQLQKIQHLKYLKHLVLSKQSFHKDDYQHHPVKRRHSICVGDGFNSNFCVNTFNSTNRWNCQRRQEA